MKLISLNVALFEDNNNKLEEFLIKQKPDIICLQEVAKRADPQVNPLYVTKDSIDKATIDLKYSFFGTTWMIKDFHQINFHQKENFDFEFGGFIRSGNYIKSKFKILKKQNVFLTNKIIKFTNWRTWPDKQSKAVQVVDLALPEFKKLRILNYHGIWSKAKIGNELTLKACQKINQLATQVSYPTIITGDFNLFPDTKSMRVFKEKFVSLVDEHNIQTTRPKTNELSNRKRNVVDYILISSGIKSNHFEVVESDVSDHLPLILDFEI